VLLVLQMASSWPWLFAVPLALLYYWFWPTAEIRHMHVVVDGGFKGAVCVTGVLACFRKYGTKSQYVYIGVLFAVGLWMRCMYHYCMATVDHANRIADSFMHDVHSVYSLFEVWHAAPGVPMIAQAPHASNAAAAALSFDLWGYTLEGCITAVGTYGVAQHKRLVDSLFVLFVVYYVLFVSGECFLLRRFCKRVWKL